MSAGEIIDSLGVQISTDDGDLPSGCVVITKFVAEDGRVVQRLSWSEGLSWIERRGMIEVARDIERCDPHNDARTEDET